MNVFFSHTCDACGSTEERVLRDTYSGLELCLECLSVVAPKTTMSPASEGDNLKKELRAMLGDALYCET